MISIGIFIISLVIIGLLTGSLNPGNYFTKTEKTDRWNNVQTTTDLNMKQVIFGVGTFIIALVISIIQPIEIQRIDAGNVGLKIDRVGNQRGIPQVRPVKGWVFYNSWLSDIAEYSIRQNHVAYNEFTVTTKGGFPVIVKPSFNYQLKADKAADLYINLLRGSDFKSLEDNFISTATTLSLNNASNKFPVDSIFNNKEGYNNAVATELNKELSAYFVVTQINPGSVPPKELAEVIKAKTETVQQAQQAELAKITAEAEAARKIAVAKGDSAAVVIAAKAEAEAIRLKQQQINPTYVDYIKWQLWDGKLPTTSVGSGTGVLLQK